MRIDNSPLGGEIRNLLLLAVVENVPRKSLNELLMLYRADLIQLFERGIPAEMPDGAKKQVYAAILPSGCDYEMVATLCCHQGASAAFPCIMCTGSPVMPGEFVRPNSDGKYTLAAPRDWQTTIRASALLDRANGCVEKRPQRLSQESQGDQQRGPIFDVERMRYLAGSLYQTSELLRWPIMLPFYHRMFAYDAIHNIAYAWGKKLWLRIVRQGEILHRAVHRPGNRDAVRKYLPPIRALFEHPGPLVHSMHSVHHYVLQVELPQLTCFGG
jgi:hypothetical protein